MGVLNIQHIASGDGVKNHEHKVADENKQHGPFEHAPARFFIAPIFKCIGYIAIELGSMGNGDDGK